MSRGSDTAPETRRSGLLTDRPRIRNLVLASGAFVTWICLNLWLSFIFRDYPVGFDSENPTLLSFVIGCLLAMIAVGITLIIARTAAARHLIIYVVASAFLLGAATLIAALNDRIDTQIAIRSFAAAIVGTAAMIAIAVAYVSSTSTSPLKHLRLLLPERRRFIAFAWPLAAWAVLALAWPFTPFNPLAHPDAPDPIIQLNTAFDDNLFATIIYVAVLVPIAEELFFRGMTITFLANAANAAVAVTISALVFALFHIDPSYFSINQVIYIFCLGIIFGTAAIVARSIWPGVLIHALNNTLVAMQSAPLAT